MTKEIIAACEKTMVVGGIDYHYIDISELKDRGYPKVDELPYSIRVLLENALRNYDGEKITLTHIENLANWQDSSDEDEVAFMPSRILLQDFTGVPAVVDLAAMRDAVNRAGMDPSLINPKVPVDLVIDHSLMVDAFGSPEALALNQKLEFQRNGERYRFLKWADRTLKNFRVIPPGTGIIHQVNLEYLAEVAATADKDGKRWLFPDTLVGTDSHTTMINGLGVLGWGVGGIEAEAAMLGQPVYFTRPEVVGVEMTGSLQPGVTATDLALTVTEMLRKEKVVGKFIEYFGEGVSRMSLTDRSTVANMAPEYGATMGYFPVDAMSLSYLETTGRTTEQIDKVESYFNAAGLMVSVQHKKKYSKVLQLALGNVEASLSGPKRPQDRVALGDVSLSFRQAALKAINEGGFGLDANAFDGGSSTEAGADNRELPGHGSVVLAAITSCTNTSNPSVMLGAGLIAKKAVELGLEVPGYVKTSMTPGSRVVADYLERAGLQTYLDRLGFNIAGYGCATCIGNSGPLADYVEKAIEDKNLTVASVLSGNRNFEGRIHPKIKANYLASPMLVVIYALAGSLNVDVTRDPVGYGHGGKPVYLKDLWPSEDLLTRTIQESVKSHDFRARYTNVTDANEVFNAIDVPKGELYAWDDSSTYIRRPDFFDGLTPEEKGLTDVSGLRILAKLGDSVTTDHISPAGAIGGDSPAGLYLKDKGVERYAFNSYGSRRGNHEVMQRGTFANIRIRNQLVPGTEGGYTRRLPDGEVLSIYDASAAYQNQGTGLMILAGKEYGTGSSRDWAAKGTFLLGVKAVLAESYERIHRSNLVGMGVLPLQYLEGQNAQTLGLEGDETYNLSFTEEEGSDAIRTTVNAYKKDGSSLSFQVRLRLDSDTEVTYYTNGGILHTLLKEMIFSV